MIPVSPYVLLRFLAAIGFVAISALLQLVILQPLGIQHPFLVFYVTVTIAAVYLEVEGGIVATTASALTVTYLFIEPIGQLAILRTEDIIYVAVFIIEGLVISYAVDRMRRSKAFEAQAKVAKTLQEANEKLQERERQLRLALDGGRWGCGHGI